MAQIPPASSAFSVRRAHCGDVNILARHRSAMFRDMGILPARAVEALERATIDYLNEAMPRGEYLAWIAEDADSHAIGGAGFQLRHILPRPGEGTTDLELGPEAIVLNVYVERAWRRRGVAAAVMHALLDLVAARGIRRVVLHASDEGRSVYERLGFAQTNEMRLVRPSAGPAPMPRESR